MKRIKLSHNKFALVDDSDYEWLNQWEWNFWNNYAVRWEGYPKEKAVFMHKVILGEEERKITDHINQNKLDNRRVNLRFCDYSQNNANKGLQKNNTSGYKGVSKVRDKWRVIIRVDRKAKNLGYFKDKIEAAKVYNDYAKKYFGEFAYLNTI